MKKVIIILIIMFSFFNKVSANYDQLAYEFKFKSLDGGFIKLDDYKDRVIVLLNFFSLC